MVGDKRIDIFSMPESLFRALHFVTTACKELQSAGNE